MLVRVAFPGVAAAFARSGHREELPHLGAGLDIVCADLSADADLAARDADVHESVAIYRRRAREGARLIGEPRFPDDRPGLLVQRDERVVALRKEHFPFDDDDAAVGAAAGAAQLGRIFPLDRAVPCVDREHVLKARGDVDHAVGRDRRRLHVAAVAVLEVNHPRAAEILDVREIDLVERRIASAFWITVQIAPLARFGGDRQLAPRLLALRRQRTSEHDEQNKRIQNCKPRSYHGLRPFPFDRSACQTGIPNGSQTMNITTAPFSLWLPGSPLAPDRLFRCARQSEPYTSDRRPGKLRGDG